MPSDARDDDRILKKTSYCVYQHRLDDAIFYPSPHHHPRPRGREPSLIVIHSISLPHGDYQSDYVRQLFLGALDCEAHPSFASLLDTKVSSHLFIRRNARILQFVPFNRCAWHAGRSSYQGQDNCNDFSLGIELEGARTDGYTPSQYEALAGICHCLINHYQRLNWRDLVGHKDIAPGRKDDPWNMNWKQFWQIVKGLGSDAAAPRN